jgi:hypothetical protein
MSKDLEKDFARVEKKVRAKMEAVALLIKEASDMALSIHNQKATNSEEPLGLTSWDFHNACRPLRDALDNAGWSSSSMSC